MYTSKMSFEFVDQISHGFLQIMLRQKDTVTRITLEYVGMLLTYYET